MLTLSGLKLPLLPRSALLKPGPNAKAVMCSCITTAVNAASCSLTAIERRTVETAMKRCAARSRAVAERSHQQALLVNVVSH